MSRFIVIHHKYKYNKETKIQFQAYLNLSMIIIIIYTVFEITYKTKISLKQLSKWNDCVICLVY